MNIRETLPYRTISFLSLYFLLFFILLSANKASSETNPLVQQFKQQDLERYLINNLEKNTVARPITRQVTLQTLPTDTDDDDMPDEWEVAQGLNPNDPDDAWLDPDGDEVLNLFEYQLGGEINNSAFPRSLLSHPPALILAMCRLLLTQSHPELYCVWREAAILSIT